MGYCLIKHKYHSFDQSPFWHSKKKLREQNNEQKSIIQTNGITGMTLTFQLKIRENHS